MVRFIGMKAIPALGICLAIVLGLTGNTCVDPNANRPPTVQQEQAKKASEAAKHLNFSDNAEIDNIKHRLELTAQPSLLGFIALVNNVGQIALYTPVQGKVTSGGKRLTPPFQVSHTQRDCGESSCDDITAAPSDEGTWGSSNEYIFFRAPTGQYFQTNMQYIYSDKPFRPTVEPLLVIGESSAAGQAKK
jgi:hypothetical protein